MKVSDAFPSAFLKADDLGGRDVTVVISKVSIEEIGQPKERKIILAFAGKEKKLVCNKTNANTIQRLYGEELEGWVGRKITLSPREVEFQGDMVWAIRVSIKVPGGTQAPAPVAPPPPPPPVTHESPSDDDVPF